MNMNIESILGLSESKWMMSPSERLAIVGLLSLLQPDNTLEFGCAHGGLTAVLSLFSNSVTTVDLDSNVVSVAAQFQNVVSLNMSTIAAAEVFLEKDTRFDLTVIDADHSRDGVYEDVRNALKFSRIILVHDSYYPPCRQGMIDALSEADVYYDLDLVPGGLQQDGLWGGLGIILPHVEYGAEEFMSIRKSVYPLLKTLWHAERAVKWPRACMDTFRRRCSHLFKRFVS